MNLRKRSKFCYPNLVEKRAVTGARATIGDENTGVEVGRGDAGEGDRFSFNF